MKLVAYKHRLVPDGPAPVATLGLLTPRGIVSLAEHCRGTDSLQEALEHLIQSFADIRAQLETLALDADAVPVSAVRLLPPVPRPGKVLCTTAVYGQPPSGSRQQLLMTLKSAESVIGPGDTIRLPDVNDSWQFVPQAALGLVLRGPAKTIRREAWRDAVFGYTCVVDVMARGDQQFGRDFWLAKADTLGPLGPCIVTVDEIPDPAALRVRSWQNGAPAQNYALAEGSHSIPEQLEFATTVMTLRSGDVVACGTSTIGQVPLAAGDHVAVEVDGIGRLELSVSRSAPAQTGADVMSA